MAELMDIDVVGGRDVVPIEAAASVRGSEIDVKMPMSELFELESDEMPALEPPPAEFKQYQSHTIRLRDNDIPGADLHYIFTYFPQTTHLVFDYYEKEESSDSDEEIPMHRRRGWARKNPKTHKSFKQLHLIPKFPNLQSIEIQNIDWDVKLPNYFAKSRTCTNLRFTKCTLGRHRESFFKAVAKNKVFESIQFYDCNMRDTVVETILQSTSITKITFRTDGYRIERKVINLLPSILKNKNLLEFDAIPRVGDPITQEQRAQWIQWNFGPEYAQDKERERQDALEAWRQIDAHLQENRQRLMVFPVLAAIQLTGSRDKAAIVDLLPEISRLLGDPPISRQRAVQIVNQIEPMVGGKRKTAEAKPLPFMFQE